MAKRTKKYNLSISGIEQLRKDLIEYRDSLNDKCAILVQRLAEAGVKVIETKTGESPLGKYITVKTDISETKTGCKAILIATGATMQHEGYAPFNTLLAVEFGAGIHYNRKENPKAPEFGMGVGTFPGQTHAFNEHGWWFWDEKKEKWMHSYGVKATMPMYSATMEIAANVVKIAREVFG